ncbi:hypothetical protein KEM56_001160 [Ascosphaera pollenicola]|nr:hypothetical protein KEM56_001160 [Ascosphaera pollenicola]
MAPSLVTGCDAYQEALHHNHHDQSVKPATISVANGAKGDGSGPGLIKEHVLDILRERAARIDTLTCQPGDEDPFFVADLREVYRQYLRWTKALPRVRPYYAVKCNPDKVVLNFLAYLGVGFDCASKSEMEIALSTGVDPGRIIYAQPCKTPSFLRYATEKGVLQMTFDNVDELYKVKHVCPDAQLFLRIFTDDSAAACRLSVKFGASLDDTQYLLETAHRLGLNVVGVSFHVGSGAADSGAFLKAIKDARVVFDEARAIGYQLRTLDIGGGFSADTFDCFGKAIGQTLDAYFPPEVEVIAEPGRYFVASAFTLAANIIARRGTSLDKTKCTTNNPIMVYLNDGVYGNFSNIIFDHQKPVPQVLIAREDDASFNEYSIWGPTCDGIDMINDSVMLPARLSVGDWLYFENMGAYTTCSRTKFNGFADVHEVVYVFPDLRNPEEGVVDFYQ